MADLEADREEFEWLCLDVQLAADKAFIESAGQPNADRVQAAVRAAMQCAVGNDLVHMTRSDKMDPWVTLDPEDHPIKLV